MAKPVKKKKATKGKAKKNVGKKSVTSSPRVSRKRPVSRRAAVHGKGLDRKGRSEIQPKRTKKRASRQTEARKVVSRRGGKGSRKVGPRKSRIAVSHGRASPVDKLKESVPLVEIFREVLERSKDSLAEYGPTYRVHANRDGSIDGELRIIMGPDYSERYAHLIENLPYLSGAWISIHNYYAPSIEEVYDLTDFLVRRGLSGIATHPTLLLGKKGQPLSDGRTRAKAQLRALAAREEIAVKLEIATGGKYYPLETVVHLRVDPSGKKPRK